MYVALYLHICAQDKCTHVPQMCLHVPSCTQMGLQVRAYLCVPLSPKVGRVSPNFLHYSPMG